MKISQGVLSGECFAKADSLFTLKIERVENGKLSVYRVVFWNEPKDYEIWDLVLKNYYSLKFCPAVEAVVKDGRANPKRKQREARRQTMQKGIGTTSQQALQLQQEEMKTELRQNSRDQKKAKKQCMFEPKQ